ncbi:DoxX family protein [Nonomuraea sp. MCN248]|uniref:DoxX family protein n=1 Tax=Nonomuraea corallina TaxID=2989783 RepID=A0ABT4SIB3_9ACTN|nr:DoxX family protein [Nonomuraea corallina]MDA0636957.1 DoxX family protein [Nonomuraea corallina]
MKKISFDVAALIARVVIGVIFVAHGLQKWTQGLAATGAGFAEIGVPLPQVAAAFATMVEMIGGVLLILGLGVRIVALLLLVDMVGAVLFAHAQSGLFVQDGGWEFAATLGAACLLLLATGGGRVGLDGLINASFRRRRTAAHVEDTVPAATADRPVADVPRTRPPVGDDTPTRPVEGGSRAGGLDDRDMRDVDRLLSDEPAQHKPPKR